MTEKLEDHGELIYFPGCEPEKFSSPAVSQDTLAMREPEDGPCDEHLFEEASADTLKFNDTFDRALARLKQKGQLRIHVHFLHPSTQTAAFGQRIRAFLSHSGAENVVKSTFNHSNVSSGRSLIRGQEVNRYTIENYYYF